MTAPIIAMTAGLHGSASTWVFNVARELALAAFGTGQLFADYREKPDAIPLDRAFVLIKSHQGSESLDRWMAARAARIVVSVRDPRDAAVSMMRRFGAPAAEAAGWIAKDGVRIARLVDAGHLVLRFECRFFDVPTTIHRVASRLGLPAPDSVVPAIFERYAIETLRRANLTTQDPVTQLWPNHIGDAVTDRWRTLPAPDRDTLDEILRPCVRHLGYREE